MGSTPPDAAGELRRLPSVDRLAADLLAENGSAATPHDVIAAARAVIAERRRELLAGDRTEVDLRERARARIASRLRRVLNASGVIVHTNLGRAPLADAAAEAVAAAARGYANLELDLAGGRRSRRDAHISELLCELTGAEDAVAVNNGAGALLLAAAALAGPDRSIAVSRGQLVEIGGGFRIPEVVAQAGAKLVEVGTTNRTTVADYRAALEQGADLILRVHPSNFHALGFVSEASIEELCALGAPVVDDVGSGVLARGLEVVDSEPPVERSIRAGATLVCFSGDKLLGAPQAGILVGRADAIAACRKHPLMRALRIGRLPLAGLVATLRLYREPDRALEEIPVLAMLATDPAVLQRRATRLADAAGGEVVHEVARVGGGALPLVELEGPVVALDRRHEPARLAARLRLGDPALLPRVAHDRVLIDPRTLLEEEVEPAAEALRRALSEEADAASA
ncbi:MAG: L-seryl-tRNA(Sec) selenium transferase [Solirubrobacterales bacterium]